MMKKMKFQRPTGMRDILPEDQKYFQKIYNICQTLVNFYGFARIDTPILENTALYEKGTGLTTDIVQKQMFAFKTKGGDYLTMRPEFTPGIIRAYLEHGMQSLPQPVKLYSIGPVFRYEHPQAGRYRQFHQFNLEVIGEANPVVDVQIIQIFYNVLTELKFKKLIIEINSIGDNQCRPYYKKLLANYFRARDTALCADCRRRLKENPLRALDCKEEKCQKEIGQPPQLIDHLCGECHQHFKEVLEFLDEIGLPYRLNPYLVRGLDYYTKTVFEIIEDTEEGRRSGSLAGGGRYDFLVKLLGGEDTKAVGGAMGIERIIALITRASAKREEEDLSSSPKEKKTIAPKLISSSSPSIFLAQLGNMAKRKSLKLLEDFRKVKIQAAESLGRDSLKAQFKIADRLGVKYTLLLGQKEALEGTIIIRNMRNGKQEIVKLEKVVREIQKKLRK